MKKEKITVEASRDHKNDEMIKYMLLNRKGKVHKDKKSSDREDIKKNLKKIKKSEDADE